MKHRKTRGEKIFRDMYTGEFLIIEERSLAFTGLVDVRGLPIFEWDKISFDVDVGEGQKEHYSHQLVLYSEKTAAYLFGDDEFSMMDNISNITLEKQQ